MSYFLFAIVFFIVLKLLLNFSEFIPLFGYMGLMLMLSILGFFIAGPGIIIIAAIIRSMN